MLKDVLKDSNLDGQIKAIFPGTKQTVRKTKQIFDVEVAGAAAKVGPSSRAQAQAIPLTSWQPRSARCYPSRRLELTHTTSIVLLGSHAPLHAPVLTLQGGGHRLVARFKTHRQEVSPIPIVGTHAVAPIITITTVLTAALSDHRPVKLRRRPLC